VSTTYRGYEVWDCRRRARGDRALPDAKHPPRVTTSKKMGPESPTGGNLFLEAKKLGYASTGTVLRRSRFVKLPNAELISMPYADAPAKIHRHDVRPARPAGRDDPEAGSRDTIYISGSRQ